MNDLILPVVLQIVFFAIVLLEMIIPSGGLLAIAALGLFFGSWYTLLTSDAAGYAGFFIMADVVLVPLVLYYGIKLMRRSPMGNNEELGSNAGFQVNAGLNQALLGKQGTTITPLRPSGKVHIGNDYFEALSDGDLIDSGAKIMVTGIVGNNLMVSVAPSEPIPETLTHP